MLNANFQTDAAVVMADVNKPTVVSPNYLIKVVVREFGQIELEVPPNLLTSQQMTDLEGAEMGYGLTGFIGANSTITGAFTRYRKTPTAAPSLKFIVSAIATVV